MTQKNFQSFFFLSQQQYLKRYLQFQNIHMKTVQAKNCAYIDIIKDDRSLQLTKMDTSRSTIATENDLPRWDSQILVHIPREEQLETALNIIALQSNAYEKLRQKLYEALTFEKAKKVTQELEDQACSLGKAVPEALLKIFNSLSMEKNELCENLRLAGIRFSDPNLIINMNGQLNSRIIINPEEKRNVEVITQKSLQLLEKNALLQKKFEAIAGTEIENRGMPLQFRENVKVCESRAKSFSYNSEMQSSQEMDLQLDFGDLKIIDPVLEINKLHDHYFLESTQKLRGRSDLVGKYLLKIRDIKLTAVKHSRKYPDSYSLSTYERQMNSLLHYYVNLVHTEMRR